MSTQNYLHKKLLYHQRLEYLDAKSARGIAKILGTIVSLAGVTIMTLYKGPAAKTIWHGIGNIQGGTIQENWLKGALLTVASCILWSIWYIMQVYTVIYLYAQ
jgi:hypothetical protein